MSRMARRLLTFLLVFGAAYVARSRARTDAPSETLPRASVPSTPAPTVTQPSMSVPGANDAASSASGPAMRPSAHSNVGFRNHAHLAEHYEKHGAEFRPASIDEYLHMAQALRDAPVGGPILEIVRPSDGTVSRFDKSTGAFLAFDSDGTIRTFFKPNDGEAYFRRQAKRAPSP